MKKTINKKGYQGIFDAAGRPDRTKAPLIKQQPQAVTLAPLDPKQPYPQEVKPSGGFTTVESIGNEVSDNDSWSKKKRRS
jgi:hypothetical protein